MKAIEEGTVLNDRYQLVKFIGKGGFSQVWLAKDLYASGAEVAVKIFVSNSGLTEEELETFRDEYENTRGLNDDRLLTPTDQFDFGHSPCLVMPFMEKGSLESKIRKQGRLSEEEIGQIIYQIGGGLRVLENHQILHNDIKPDNMLIDGRGNYRLADFGISAKMRNTFLRASRLRGETFNYRSPEKIQGNDVNAQSDIFSFGVTLYEVCKGIFPEGVSLGDNVIKGYPKPTIDTEYYSRRLEQLIHACLNRNPHDRPSAARLESYAQHFMANGFWEEIAEYTPEEEYVRRTVPRSSQEHQPAAAHAENVPISSNFGSSSQPYTPPVQPPNIPAGGGNNTFRVAIAALLLVVLGFGGFAIWDMFIAPPPIAKIESPSNPLPESQPSNVAPNTLQPIPKETDVAETTTKEPTTEKEPPVVNPIPANVTPTVNQQEKPSKKQSDELPYIPPKQDQTTTDKPKLTGEALYQQAVKQYEAGKYRDAVTTLNEYIPANNTDWRGYYIRGSAYLALDNYSYAISDLTKSINLEPDRCGIYSDRGLAYHQSGNIGGAVSDYKKAIEKGCKGTYNNYAFALYDYGSYAEAKKSFAKALTVEDNADTNIGMAITCYKLGDTEKAKAYLQKASELEPCFRRSDFESCVKGKYWYTREQVATIRQVQQL